MYAFFLVKNIFSYTIMSRKDITALLLDVLINSRLSDRKYYAKEVTIDYGTTHPKRVDVMQFIPGGVVYPSDIEKGTFTCYEIKSCKADVYSGNGLNFFGEQNYIVTTMETYKKLQPDIRDGKLDSYIRDNYPESSLNYGILVPVPCYINVRNTKEISGEYESPTKFDGNPSNWKLFNIYGKNMAGRRKRSMVELLFCMLRSAGR